MGYYTRYSLRQLRNPISEDALGALIARDECASDALQPDGDSKRAAKWYDHEESLCALSARQADTIFLLHADGEDLDGIWDKYFLDGKLLHTETLKGLPKVDLDSLMK